MPKPALKFDVHPPERRRKTGGVIVPGCCCCCCCCLHTLGGLIGAAIAPSHSPGEMRGKAIYWRGLGITALLSIVFGHLLTYVGNHPGRAGDEPFVVLFMIFMFFPAVQLAASVLSLIYVAAGSMELEEKSAANAMILRITQRLFIGTLIGVAVMVGIGIVGSMF